MSGFIVGFGRPDPLKIEGMFDKIRYRGPHLSGIIKNHSAIMAQNYLRADCPEACPESDSVPVTDSGNKNSSICYDGQMGNCNDLCAIHGIAHGPFKEERLFLYLFKKYGHEMFQHLKDAIFAFVISDGENLFAARDLLGIKTLFYGRRNGVLYLSSELKSLIGITDDIHEFPPGYYMDSTGTLFRFDELPKRQPEILHSDPNEIAETIRDIIQRSFQNRVNFESPTGSLLSGGIDSSVIAWMAANAFREKFGKDARLKTFALGVGESEDITCARIMADTINSDHYEVIVDLDQILAVLPQVIWSLESFDPSLVRSSVSNYLISKHAREQGIEVLLSGEGGDEVFCGYLYLKDFPAEELFEQQMKCIGFLHNNASLRLDRMNLCNSIRVVTPLISGELLTYAMGIPAEYKQRPVGDQKIEKWIFRKAYEKVLPKQIVWRLKQEFSQGSGSADVLPKYFDERYKDEELKEAQGSYPMVRSKEELYYFKIFIEHFGTGKAIGTVGQWIRL
jgi:asparagine synthase (glutamine-hydrolysing)